MFGKKKKKEPDRIDMEEEDYEEEGEDYEEEEEDEEDYEEESTPLPPMPNVHRKKKRPAPKKPMRRDYEAQKPFYQSAQSQQTDNQINLSEYLDMVEGNLNRCYVALATLRKLFNL